MSHLLKACSVTYQMIERRDYVKRIYGDQYAIKMRIPTSIIRGVKKDTGKSTLDAGLEVGQKAIADGNRDAVNLIIAAMVDMIEAGEV